MIRWKCSRDGCFAERHIPDHNAWDLSYPGRISMMDIDQIAELAGWFSYHEWKDASLTDVQEPQAVCYQRAVEQIKKGHIGPSYNICLVLYGHAGKTNIERFELMVDTDHGAMRGPMMNYGSPKANFEAILLYKMHWALMVAPVRMTKYLMDCGFETDAIVDIRDKQFEFLPVVPNEYI